MTDASDRAAQSAPITKPRKSGASLIASGGSQFAAQLLGVLIAVLVSHLIARRMGIGAEADAFLLGRRLITSVTEAVNQVMVMVFIPLTAAQAAMGMRTGTIMTRLGGMAFLFGALLAGVMIWTAPMVVAAVAPDFPADTANLAIRVMVILALCLPATVVGVAFSSYCNVMGRFGGPAMIRQLPRAAVVVALLTAASSLAVNAAIAFTAGSFALAALTLAFAIRIGKGDGVAASTKAPSNPAVVRRGTAAAVLAIGSLACILLETAFAARQGEGSVALLDLSQRLGTLAGNTLGMAMALVAFSDMVGRASRGETADLGRRFQIGTMTVAALVLFVQIPVLINARAIVDIIYAHGAFTEDAATRLVRLLQLTTLTPLGAVVTRMMLVRILAEHDLPIVRIVVATSVIDFLSRLVLFSALTPVVGLLAIPMSLAIAPIAPVLWMLIALRKRRIFAGEGALAAVRPVIAASVIGGVGFLAGTALAPMVTGALRAVVGDVDKLASISQLVVSGAVGLIAFGVSARLLGLKLKRR